MKETIVVLGIVALVSFTMLTGCGLQELNYQGKVRPVTEVEEMLGDYLESENPNLDINVTITSEAD